MFKKYIIAIIILVSILSCKNTNSKIPIDNLENNRLEKYNSLFEIKVPPIIKDRDKIEQYIANNFWNDTIFIDTSMFAISHEKIKKHMYNYFIFLSEINPKEMKKSIEKYVSKIAICDSITQNDVINFSIKFLDDPNSPALNEDIYIVFLNNLIKSGIGSSDVYINYLTRALKNRPGDVATNFSFISNRGKESTLHSINADYIILLFYDPECRSCVEYFNLVDKLTESITKVKLTKLAIYTGENAELWLEESFNKKPDWICGFNNDYSITTNKLYDRRATPSVYILDKSKRVLMKDVSPVKFKTFIQSISTQ